MHGETVKLPVFLFVSAITLLLVTVLLTSYHEFL